ncbi:MAG: hypothetical protein WCT44_02630 [Candidatus Paceibacterota bacterium]
MSEMTLQLKTRIQNVNIMNNNIAVGKLTLNGMLVIFSGLALLYALILGNMVFNIVERKSLEKEALVLSNEVSELELSYLSISNSIDMAMSSEMGFQEKEAVFATRRPLGSIKLANNEI